MLLDSVAINDSTFDMALRVLLADESSTIKKVMQLALSDFAVEVKSVPVGLDVLSVTKSFKPDIIFADVLLTKRSGYEVCAEVKNDSETAHTPVILMWSGFMNIDEAKASGCRADRRLEKPFDADHLRSLVTDLVPKTKTNPVSEFLSFPTMPQFDESAQSSDSVDHNSNSSDIYSMPELSEVEVFDDAFATDEEFAAVPLNSPRNPREESEEGGWAHQDLNKFKIQLPEGDSSDFTSKFVIPKDEEIDDIELDNAAEFQEIVFEKRNTTPAPSEGVNSFVHTIEKSVKEQMMETLQKGPQKAAASNAQPNIQSKVDLNSNMMEKIIREEAREIIESVCWKVLPEIAERVIRDELNKLLKETEKSI